MCGIRGLRILPFFHSRVALYALMAILSVVVLIGHQALPPMDRDESRFAQASKQMQQTGDYVTVRFQDELRAKNRRAFTGCNHHLPEF